MIKIDESAKYTKEIQEADIQKFADVSGDMNPIHLDEEYANNSMFGKRIAHGMLSASFISNVIGNQLPGEGTIYMKQSLEFCKPVYIGDTVTAVVTIKDIDELRGNFILDTKCYNQDNEIVIKGEAYVKNKKYRRE